MNEYLVLREYVPNQQYCQTQQRSREVMIHPNTISYLGLCSDSLPISDNMAARLSLS